MTLQAALGVYLALGIVGMLISIGADGPRGLGATSCRLGIGCSHSFARRSARGLPRLRSALKSPATGTFGWVQCRSA